LDKKIPLIDNDYRTPSAINQGKTWTTPRGSDQNIKTLASAY
jgi:hypothetical protein